MTTHDALHAAVAAAPRDSTAKAVFADLLDEDGRPGAQLLRAAAERDLEPGFDQSMIRGARPSVHGHTIVTLHKPGTLIASHLIWPAIDVYKRVWMHVTHWADETAPGWARRSMTYSVPVRSLTHLHTLVSDWPTAQAEEMITRLTPEFAAEKYAAAYRDGLR